MDQVGKVVNINNGMAKLEVRRVSSCGSNCASCSAACEQAPDEIEVINTLNAQIGDFVEIKTDSSKVLKYMLILYGIPLIFLIIGIIIGTSIFTNELASFALGLLFLFISAVILNLIDRNSNLKSSDISYMTKKL